MAKEKRPAGRMSIWPSYVLFSIGIAWLLQEQGLSDFSLPFGPIAVIWVSFTLILLIKQSRGR